MAIRIAICSKILREYELSEAVNIAAEIGYEGIEIFGVERHLPAATPMEKIYRLAAQMRNVGIEAVTLRTDLGGFSQKSDDQCLEEVEVFRRYLDMAEELECELIGVRPGGPPVPAAAREDHRDRAAHYLRACCDLALSRDIAVVLQNNFGLSATVDSALDLIARVDMPNLGVNYDPGNLYRMDRYYGIEALARFGERVWNVQVKDCYHDETTDDYRLLLGEGEVDYRSIFTRLQENEYDGHVSAECHREPDAQLNAVDIARHEYQAIRVLLASV